LKTPKSLDQFVVKTLKYLNQFKAPYFIIGGLAAAILGEPRFTHDIDIDIVMDPEVLPDFLERAQTQGFQVDIKTAQSDAQSQGAFRIAGGRFHADFIVASTELEKEAIQRRRLRTLYGVRTYFPTAEDLILLKVIPGRPQDLLDAERVARRHHPRLDMDYLSRWAKILSDQAEDLRIYNTVDRLLQRKMEKIK